MSGQATHGINGFFKTMDPVFYPLISGIGHGFKGAFNSLMPKPPAPPSTPDTAPGLDPAAAAARDAAAEQARRRTPFGRDSTNPLGAVGDTSTPNLASKSLLGI